ncbi:hypothetical protein [Desulfofustis glycolicus]|uniref:hypothetical protein n=1 Tax=Desulfofustis glycolicus TaxID=51195 RepID=UPI001160F422|nr:hypothetical protein [Desulfofustis glycolicus]
MNYNPGASDAFRVEFLWYLFFFVFTLLVSIDEKTIIRMVFCSSFSLSVVGLYIVLNPVFGKLSFLRWIPFESVQYVNGIIRTGLPNIAFISFLFPILLFINTSESTKNKFIYYMIISMSFFFILLAGRRIVQIITALFLIVYFFTNLKRMNLTIMVPVFFFLIVLLLFQTELLFFIDFNSYYNLYIKTLITDAAEDKRFVQMIELFRNFAQNPIIGVGFGKGISTHIANLEKPWHYELTYFLYLYQTGIVGISIFFGLFISLFKKLKRNGFVGKAISMGLAGYLIASGTNPYMSSGFDYKFPVIICLLYISYISKIQSCPKSVVSG